MDGGRIMGYVASFVLGFACGVIGVVLAFTIYYCVSNWLDEARKDHDDSKYD